MTQEKTTPLRERMIEDMRIRGMGDKAQKSHIRAVKHFAGFLKRSPDTATPDDLRAYQLHMTDTGVTPPTYAGFFLHVWVLSRLFRRLFIEGLLALHRAGELSFFGDLNGLSDAGAFAAYLAPLRKTEWVFIVPEARLGHDVARGASWTRRCQRRVLDTTPNHLLVDPSRCSPI